MENQNAPVSLRELNERQLRDWKQLREQLAATNAADSRIVYCDRRIEQLETEAARLDD